MKLAAVLAVASFAYAAPGPTIFYSKYFKGSNPEYTAVTVERSGQAVYQETAEDDNPIRFKIADSQAAEIFAAADKLDHFRRPLESNLKVAHMGVKTFRFEDGGVKSEVKFNYSEDPDARALADWFERIAETEQDFIALERAVKFDKLGVQHALLQMEIAYDKKRLVAPAQFLPLLDRVAKNESYMHIARERAAKLAEMFRDQEGKAAN
jgi:hypothetical protein